MARFEIFFEPPVMKSIICPVCRGTKVRNWGVKNAYPLFRCLDCTHIFAGNVKLASNISDPEEFRKQITNGEMADDATHFKHLTRGEFEGGHVFLTTRMILDDWQQQSSEAKNWLDIGCGSGYLVAKLQEQGVEATGIEPGGWGQIAARERQIRVVQGLLDFDTFDEKFDGISATDVLEHQSDPYKLMQLMKHYVADNGRVYLSFPLADTVWPRLLKAKWKMVIPPTHCSFFTRRSFARLAEDVGFKIERFIKYNSGGIRGWGRLGLKFATANKIGDALGLGDQGLVILSPCKASFGLAHHKPTLV
jgi:SAM-dependent methyltransferase